MGGAPAQELRHAWATGYAYAGVVLSSAASAWVLRLIGASVEVLLGALVLSQVIALVALVMAGRAMLAPLRPFAPAGWKDGGLSFGLFVCLTTPLVGSFAALKYARNLRRGAMLDESATVVWQFSRYSGFAPDDEGFVLPHGEGKPAAFVFTTLAVHPVLVIASFGLALLL